MVAQSEQNGTGRPHSQDERPPVGRHRLGIEPSTRSLVHSGSGKKAL